MQTEPTVLIGAVRAIIVALTAFGIVQVSDAQAAAAIGLLVSVYAVAEAVLTWYNRSKVASPATVAALTGTPPAQP